MTTRTTLRPSGFSQKVSIMNRMRSYTVATALLLSLLVAGPASAQAKNAFGGRAGLGLQPDQFVVGVQSRFGNIGSAFRLAPSFDIGLGDNVTTYTANGDMLVSLPLPKSSTSLYLGAGPSVAVFDHSGGSDTELGLTFVGGMMTPMGSGNNYNMEVRLGVGDVPDVRFLVGLYLGW